MTMTREEAARRLTAIRWTVVDAAEAEAFEIAIAALGAGWLPIESAPRDVSVLVTFSPDDICPSKSTPGVMVAYWDAYYANGGGGYDGGSGWTDATTGDECRLHYGEPTHFHPLPPSPQGETK